jgi:hypothetical protein
MLVRTVAMLTKLLERFSMTAAVRRFYSKTWSEFDTEDYAHPLPANVKRPNPA